MNIIEEAQANLEELQRAKRVVAAQRVLGQIEEGFSVIDREFEKMEKLEDLLYSIEDGTYDINKDPKFLIGIGGQVSSCVVTVNSTNLTGSKW